MKNQRFNCLFVGLIFLLLPTFVGATAQAKNPLFANNSVPDLIVGTDSEPDYKSDNQAEEQFAEFYPDPDVVNEDLADLSIIMQLNRQLPNLDENNFKVTGAVLKEVKKVCSNKYKLRLFCSGCGCPAISLNLEKFVGESRQSGKISEYVHYIPGADGRDVIIGGSHFVLVPATKLPDGELVPPFYCAKFVAGKRYKASSCEEKAVSEPTTTPWVSISAYDARAVAESAGCRLISEKQWLAIAHNSISVAENWKNNRIGSRVAEGGGFYRGLANDSVDGPVPAYFADRPYNPGAFGLDNRIKKLTNGAEIWDIGGNVWQWVALSQTERHLLAKIKSREWIEPSSLPAFASTLKVESSAECGLGKILHQVEGVCEFAARGGTWSSKEYAGAFSLNLNGKPDAGYPMVGFRMVRMQIPAKIGVAENTEAASWK